MRTRRQFLKELLTLAAGSTLVDVDRLLWVPGEKSIFIPSAAQIKFLASDKLMLHGMAYHASDATIGKWLGLPRESVYPEMQRLIKILEEDKRGPS